ncbi:MAG: UvrD-helicase domain-containing protein [Azoarcus sp.]|jgi:exodeoxyribonuclease V beta subunit|nr:UvrD-helicase domain-containing protein [Azoarcus sp.]
MRPTPGELDVFACPLDGIALIEASAGTGKTWNICALYLRQLLEKNLPVARLLVVTFTRAATAELFARIRERIAAILRAPGGGAPDGDAFILGLIASARTAGLDADEMRRRLQGALAMFDEAAIFTIHGFCQRALVDAPFSAGLSYTLEINENDSEARLDATRDFWRREVASVDAALANYLLACGDSPERWAKWLKEAQAYPLAHALWEEDKDGDENGKNDIGALTSELDRAYSEARRLWDGGDAPRRAIDENLGGLNKKSYKPALIDEAFRQWMAWLTADDARAGAVQKNGQGDKLHMFSAATLENKTNKGLLPPVHPFFNAAQTLLNARASLGNALEAARRRLLRRFIEEAGAELRRNKQATRRVAFDDILYNTHEALTSGHQPWLAAALHTRYPVALIDEFQDTDPLQLAIFRRIYAEEGRHGTLFLVGDPKQAIYSFRGADLQTYLGARNLADAHYTLGTNRRSAPALVAACNRLFSANPAVFMEPGLDFRPVRAHEPALRLIDRTPSGEEERGRGAALRLWRIPRGGNGNEDGGARENNAGGERLLRHEARNRAAAASAAEIARLLAAGRRNEICIGARGLMPTDVAVLVRTHREGGIMRRALAAKGVGSVELSQGSVFASSEAEELKRVLLAVADPARERLLKTALATMLMGWNASALEHLADDDNELVRQFERFAAWRENWLRHGFAFMLWRWMDEAGVAARLLALDDGERRLTNLLHLAELLQQEAGSDSPAVLLRLFARRRAENDKSEDALLRLESDRNLVQIVTIHRAKGLQYGIVFCPFLFDGYTQINQDGPMKLWHDANGGQIADWRHAPAEEEQTRIKAFLASEQNAETMRLIYVALTRAVHRCYLVIGCYGKKSRKSVSYKESTHSLLNWTISGSGMTPADWQKTDTSPAEIDARWRALAIEHGSNAIPTMHGGVSETSVWGAEAHAEPYRGIPDLQVGVTQNEDAITLDDLPSGEGEPLPPEDGQAVFSAPRAPKVREGWRLGSFSALASGAAHEDAARDHDARIARATLPENSATSIPDNDILFFPRGALAGDCIHAVFESLDFTRPETRASAIARALAIHPQTTGDAAHLTRMLAGLVDHVLAAPLLTDDDGGLRLSTVSMARRLTELQFYLPAPRLDADALNHWLAACGYKMPKLTFRDLTGYLKGYIDLVFEHAGRYWVLDWKSNHLGNTPADYAPAALEAEMSRSAYHLQHLLYTVALHRHLGLTLPGYDYERHFGGALYLFVRGLRPGWQINGAPTGVYRHRASKSLIESLDTLLAGKLPASVPIPVPGEQTR